ncbi:MAG: acetoacetate--CoA ligase [Firmicutes bacterium]|jgi:acetoacetyl-CoA synthetase|uniref:Acetoacetate--CoA ligase n=1 Tax=Sulfobacillus benefaciens TaxID=453960 RepID=A0A2T2XBI0_9FIRM|nr:acetoacetate--CoA ligase [Bacillota bacterium]MCL5014811.1 acetoacetate--CoA ligase [Bacillota bacterium]PSR31871.1 MAG: acetoacetate--CoA ligase [Sulfobacillus benefaciens]
MENRGRILWNPTQEILNTANITQYQRWLHDHWGLRDIDEYQKLWNWSVTHVTDFWASLFDYFRIAARSPYKAVQSGTEMPDIHWFEGAKLNYAEHAFRSKDLGPAVIFRREDGRETQWSWQDLEHEVQRVRGALKKLGVRAGDRVAAYLPNIPETVAAFLATASLGAVWSSCSPDFGIQAVMDRFLQIEPKILLAVDGYYYGGKSYNCMPVIETLQEKLPSLVATVLVPYLQPGVQPGGMLLYNHLESSDPLEFQAVSFEHPLWILYSSGTTGLPKAIVQGHGGILLSHLMALTFHLDLRPKDRFMWFTTTGWMMWNMLVSGLLVGATIVLYDGSPSYPVSDTLWQLAEETRMTFFGTSAAYLTMCHKMGLEPERRDLSAMRGIGSTGSPLSPESFEWVYRHLSPTVWLSSLSGGTDVCTAVVGGVPTLPVRSGEIQCRYLGSKVEAFDPEGRSVVNEVGELVLTEPIPSMPVYLYGDKDKQRYRASYFDTYPGIWRHGDWILIHEDGSVVIFGRSDATINRGGIRMGTSDFYRVVDADPQVADSIVVDLSSPEKPNRLILFIVAADPGADKAELERNVRKRLRKQLSPRHEPDNIIFIPEVPKTLNGKKMEVPLKRILAGGDPKKAFNPGTMSNPHAMDYILQHVKPLFTE